jgi:two-component system, OmpR family, sensor histidine kinase KdpD
MSDGRPNPDKLLEQVAADEAKAQQGRLKIFFGYAAGVGKTFSMLEAARREKDAGVDVVVGYVEPHGRKETEALLDGLEVFPPLLVPYRGVRLREFDLDAVLRRQPSLALVDELAHSNADGFRHAKRWQDVFELLDAGINVYTTLNVQHIESLNDVIAQITGVAVRETLPDAVIDRADDIELIDITPDELLQRLQQGKVYISTQAERALEHFFQHPKLAALRELSLRQAARRLQRDVDEGRIEVRSQSLWPTSERLLVCVGPSPKGAKLIRAAKRMASVLDAEWLAVSVRTGQASQGSIEAKHQVAAHLSLAESLGAEVHQLVGENVASTILNYARSRNVGRVLVGKTADPIWRRWLVGSTVDQLIRKSGDVDIFLVQGEEEESLPREERKTLARRSSTLHGISALAVVLGATSIGWLMQRLALAEANIIMVYLAGVAIVSVFLGRGASILASVLSVILYDVLFVPPYYSFAVADAQYLLTFAVMLVIGLVISGITVRVRQQVTESQERERMTHALYRLSRQLGEASGVDFLVSMAGDRLKELFEADVTLALRDSSGRLDERFGPGVGGSSSIIKDGSNEAVATWVAEHHQSAGRGTNTLPNASALFLPLEGAQGTIGVVGIRTLDPDRLSDPDQRQLLDTCVRQIALAIERDSLALKAYDAKLEVESERLRSSLLSSVSHDLRTPLSVISGATSSILESSDGRLSLSEQSLLQSVREEAERLSRLVENLLDMTRLESSSLNIHREPHVVEELVGSAIVRVESLMKDQSMETNVPPDLPLTKVDSILVEQMLVNLLENAIRHSPATGIISVTAKEIRGMVELSIRDQGQGLHPGEEKQIFEKFFQSANRRPDSRRGVGLGLAICKAVAEIHGGTIVARNHIDGGAEFKVTLPVAQGARLLPELEEARP